MAGWDGTEVIARYLLRVSGWGSVKLCHSRLNYFVREGGGSLTMIE